MYKIKTIDVNAKEWIDKINGNSYFSAVIILNYGMKNERSYVLPFQYGYGEHYIDVAKQFLFEKVYFKENDVMWRLCKENNIILRTSKKENCKKRELAI